MPEHIRKILVSLLNDVDECIENEETPGYLASGMADKVAELREYLGEV